MPIHSAFINRFARGRDIHLIRGTDGPDLDTKFSVAPVAGGSTTLAAHKSAHPSDFEYEFRPTFNATLKTIGGRQLYEGFGFRVDRENGSVSFLSPTPPLSRNNFLVELRILKNVGGSQGLSPIPIRIHVHAGVRELRLTPPVMSVPLMPPDPGAPQPVQTWLRRFAFRAEFTDDSVGDLTDHDGVSWEIPGVSNTMTGSFLSFQGTVGQEATVRATWDGAPGMNAEAKLKALKPWHGQDADTPAIEFIDGHRSMWERFLGEPPLNTAFRPESVPNLLFIAAGFKAEDANSFRGITNKIVHDLKRDIMMRPYDLLATSMNFWRIVPEAGLRGGRKVFCEVYIKLVGSDLQAFPVPSAKRITKTGAVPWTLENLIYHIGLPIAAEVVGPAAKDDDELRDEWKAVRTTDLPELDASDEVLKEWRALGTRQFVDIPDEFLAMQTGVPPEADKVEDWQSLLFEYPDELYEMLRSRIAANGVKLEGTGLLERLGTLWASQTLLPRPTAPLSAQPGDFWPDSSTTPPTMNRWTGSAWTPAKEWPFDHRSLMVMIASSPSGRANAEGFVKMPLASGTQPIPVKPVPGKRALELNYVSAPPGKVSRSAWRTIAHEVSHLFGLGDEYNEHSYSQGASEATYGEYGNVMSGEIQPKAGDPIDPNKIKWNWLRARKAAALVKPAKFRTGTAVPQIELPIPLDDAKQFAVNDKVFLRTRRRSAPLTGPLNSGAQATHHSDLLTIIDKSVASPAPPEAPYESLIVASSPPMTAADLAQFVEGSVVYMPLDADSPPLNYGPHQRLISKRVFNYMVGNKRPLSPEPFDPVAEAGDSGRTQVPPSETYPLLFCGKWRPRIIGLYQGAAHHALGAFRPSGICVMRNEHAEDTEFCHACRYILVDMIDPSKHREIDVDYDDRYPD